MAAFHDIRKKFNGDNEGPWFLIHRGNLILALTLRQDLNPDINKVPAEVWVGAEPPLPEWGSRLAFDTGAVPLYVSPGEGGGYTEHGIYHVIGSTDATEELEHRMKTPGIGKLSRVVFLSGPHKA